MNSNEKINTTITKFEEFFSTQYKDEIFNALEAYPEERSVTIDYTDLEMFDPDLADHLIESPEEIKSIFDIFDIGEVNPAMEYTNGHYKRGVE